MPMSNFWLTSFSEQRKGPFDWSINRVVQSGLVLFGVYLWLSEGYNIRSKARIGWPDPLAFSVWCSTPV